MQPLTLMDLVASVRNDVKQGAFDPIDILDLCDKTERLVNMILSIEGLEEPPEEIESQVDYESLPEELRNKLDKRGE
ncbi:hypothetical protein M3_0123 [Lysinibacillus phage vB_LfM_LysYB1]|nr:hypothetical protein M3_0123 [Lysinibacillus phage vB_LfM_LysYB1]WAB25367.1 hypothetical protein M5_0189 [Lysinibacillus phage vB_LfM_LysYB2]